MATTPPPNFSWVVEGVLCASGYPRHPDHFKHYVTENVGCLVTLTEGRPPPSVIPQELELMHIAIPDFHSPSTEQVTKFIDKVMDCRRKKKAVAVHCMWGRGRTGSMLACYLVHAQGLDARRAVAEVRRLRPCSIETAEQEQAVYRYERRLRGAGAADEPEVTREEVVTMDTAAAASGRRAAPRAGKSVQFKANVIHPEPPPMDVLKI